MCGFFGLFSPRGADPAAARRALTAMHHRGPDAQGVWESADGRVVLAHARLKILDLSDGANQPMTSPDGQLTLVYNGEIVNYQDVRGAYRGDWKFRTSGDSEVLLATFAARGIAAIEDWVGMFAFAVHDARRNALTLVRDRFGIKPLYLAHLPDGGIAFGSEIPPLLPLLARVRADEDVIRTYLETGQYDCSSRTFFAGITALEPGTALEIDLASSSRRSSRWYDLTHRIPDLSQAAEPELVEEGARRVETAIREHLVADVRVGLNVSGGVDSSMLAAVAKRHVRDIHLFTQDYEPPYSEAHFVREVASGCALHVVSLDSADILAVLGATVRRQAEPFGGTTVCGYDALYAQADREGVTVLLDGNGVDEAFLGYQKYHSLHVASSASSSEWEKRAQDYSRFWSATPPSMGSMAGVGRSIDGTTAVRPEAIGQGLLSRSTILEARGQSTADLEPARAPAIQDLLGDKIPRGLRFNDRMSMGRSKELRVPFLDHRVVEFGCGVPLQHLLNGFGSKAIFRRIAARHVAPTLAFAAKRSVQSPQREWLRNEWRGVVEGVLGASSLQERGWIDQAKARALYETYCSDGGDNSFFIWQWINLEMWAREFIP